MKGEMIIWPNSVPMKGKTIQNMSPAQKGATALSKYNITLT